MDAARNSYWSSFGGRPGLSWLMTDFREMLRGMGLDEDLLVNLFVQNPARAFAFTKPV